MTSPLALSIQLLAGTEWQGMTYGRSTSGAAAGGTVFNFYDNGTSIAFGSDNGQAYDGNYYDGPEGHKFKNIRMRYAGGASVETALANGASGTYGVGTYAMRDWRGGNIALEDVDFGHYDYTFWGIQSDFDVFTRVTQSFNHSGFYLGPRSDQATFYDFYPYGNDTALTLDSCTRTVLYSPKFVDNGTHN